LHLDADALARRPSPSTRTARRHSSSSAVLAPRATYPPS